jgi:hypothetical protein
MNLPGPKRLIYRFKDGDQDCQIEDDLDGVAPLPRKDQVIEIEGIKYKVERVMVEAPSELPGPIPVVRIYLTDLL